jgi:hypothetical protein
MTFECGRNKSSSVLLGDVDAAADHEPAPADITKLAREIKHASLRLGYALEFYDEDDWEAKRLIERVRQRILTSQCDGLCVVVLSCKGGEKPSLTFLPESWDERLRHRFGTELEQIESLSCARTRKLVRQGVRNVEGYTNRVRGSDFLSSCSPGARLLIESIERHFHKQLKLIFGGSSMTVNLRPSGKLLRINVGPNTVSEVHSAVLQEIALSLHESTPRSTYRVAETEVFRTAILRGIGKVLNLRMN